jgi:imidazolonepropionase-like amidohydrolase
MRTKVLAACLLVVGCDSPEPRPNATLFEGALLITGDAVPPMENSAFLIEDGRVVEIGYAGSIELPPEATRVDLTNKIVIPALINAHVHLGQTREELTEELQRYAYYGVGTVQSLGLDSGEAVMEMRGESVPGGARYLTADRGVTAPEPGRSEVPHWITSEAEARAAVQDLGQRGVDLVKIWVDDRNGQYDKLGPELYGPVIAEAHSLGQKVAAHIFTLEDAKGLLAAGIDAFAHSIRDVDVDEEALALFAANPEVVLIPNLPGSGSGGFGVQARNLAALNQAGVKIAMGTGGGSPPAAHQEMADMVTAGMSPAAVLVAATGTSAAFLGLEDIGTLAAGNVADFVILDRNPLSDIANTEAIESVYLRGEPVDRAAIGARIEAGG